jgi:hypothetical protein
MGTTGDNLATAFEQANETLISTLSNMSDEQWRRKCDGEGWPVAVTAHHIASSREQVMQMIRLLATSPGRVEFTQEMLNHSNAEHAKLFPDPNRTETIELAKKSGTEVASELRGMSEEAFANGAEVSGFGRHMTAAGMVEGALIGHTHGHLESIRSAAAS